MPTYEEMLITLELQRNSSKAEGKPSAKTRIDRIDRAINLLQKNGKILCDAMSEDFGHRSKHQY